MKSSLWGSFKINTLQSEKCFNSAQMLVGSMLRDSAWNKLASWQFHGIASTAVSHKNIITSDWTWDSDSRNLSIWNYCSKFLMQLVAHWTFGVAGIAFYWCLLFILADVYCEIFKTVNTVSVMLAKYHAQCAIRIDYRLFTVFHNICTC